MSTNHAKTMIRYAEGDGTNLGKVHNKIHGWSQFAENFESPPRGRQTIKEYMRLHHTKQLKLKSSEGYFIAAHCKDGIRSLKNVGARDIVTLDLDELSPQLFEQILARKTKLSHYEHIIHSTRKHTAEAPRIRMIFLLNGSVSKDSYAALSRFMAYRLEPSMEAVDNVSFRPAQMMFWPTLCKDSDYVFKQFAGDRLSPRKFFAWFLKNKNWNHTDFADLPQKAGEDLRERADKAEDPREKVGPVGEFCRAFSITEAMDVFIPGVYELSDTHSEKPRYSYMSGTSANGAVIEDDDTFLYSHHGSDPCADMLVNAFDMVRIHLFDSEDSNVDTKEKTATQLPSYKAMIKHIGQNEKFRSSRLEEKYAGVLGEDGFDDLDDPDAELDIDQLIEGESHNDDLLGDLFDSPKPKKKKKAKVAREKKGKLPFDKKWFIKLEANPETGILKSTTSNISAILLHDARFRGKIAHNEHSHQIICRSDIDPKSALIPTIKVKRRQAGDMWSDANDNVIRAVLEGPNGKKKTGYAMPVTDRNLKLAVSNIARLKKYHPIKDYLKSLEWDGKKRVRKMFVKYLGTDDNPYTREVAELILVAAIARVFCPGHKFDSAPVLQGAQGAGKSTFIKILFGKEYTHELDHDLRDTQKTVEVMQGNWAMEFAELSALDRSHLNAAKSFMTQTHDKVRMAYAHNTSEFGRQCVFLGTSNGTKYLRDTTGNRRWWPLKVGVKVLDFKALTRNRDQLWAEAMTIYRKMCKKYSAKELPLYLHWGTEAYWLSVKAQEDARERSKPEYYFDDIDNYLSDQNITAEEILRTRGRADDFDDLDILHGPCIRIAVHLAELKEHALSDANRKGTIYNNDMVEAMALADDWHKEPQGGPWVDPRGRSSKDGVRHLWYVRKGATPLELKKSYILLANLAPKDFKRLAIEHLQEKPKPDTDDNLDELF